MSKKLLCFSIVFFISMFLLNISYATDISTYANNSIESNAQPIDDSAYSVVMNDENAITDNFASDYEDAATTTTAEYENETELSISNIINIVLISVGIVLILLGIAIIIKLK